MAKVFNRVAGGGGSGVYASITVTGVSADGTVTVTTPKGVVKTGIYITGTQAWYFGGLNEFGMYTVTATEGSTTKTEDVLIDVVGNFDVAISFLEIVAFADGTIEQISAMLDAAYNGDIDLADYWAIGDVRNVTYNGSTYHMRLIHKFTGTPGSNDAYAMDNGKYPQYAVEITPQLGTSTYMSSNAAQKYFNGTLHSTINTTIYGGLDSGNKGLLKQWKCYVGKENTGSGSITGLYNQMVYLAAPAAKEFGSSNGYNADENNKLVTFDYYNNSSTAASRRKDDKTGSSSYYWLRSPSNSSFTGYRACHVGTSNGDVDDARVDNSRGVIAVGCI